MKRFKLGILVIFALSLVFVSGCKKTLNDSDKIQVVCTNYPIYDWVREIIGDDNDNIELTWLLDDGVDMHSFQPGTNDIALISSCDVLIYVGGESDEWMSDVLDEAVNDDMKVINLLDCLGDNKKQEEIKEGMESEEGEHEHDEEGEHEHEEEYDEHVWLSLKNAKHFVEEIKSVLIEVDEDNKEVYKENCDSYVEKLDELDKQYENVVKNAAKDTIVVADRFPFLYLVEDYGLDYYAAFVGCSAETEASFETIVFLSDKIDELGLSSVLVIDNSDEKIAQTVISNTNDKNQKVLILDSLQSVTKEDVKAGKTYLSSMTDNLKIIEESLK